jgi:hypothetical protein
MWKRCPKAIARQIAIFEPLREFPDVHLAYAKDPRQLAAGPFAVEVVAPFQGHMSDQLGFRFAAPGTGRRQQAWALARFRREASGDGIEPILAELSAWAIASKGHTAMV